MDKLKPSYNDIHNIVKKIADKVTEFKPDVIIAISGGGLIPARMIAFMFGVYYLSIAIGNKLAHYVGGDIDRITQEYSLSGFFLIFTIIPIGLGFFALIIHLKILLKKLFLK